MLHELENDGTESQDEFLSSDSDSDSSDLKSIDSDDELNFLPLPLRLFGSATQSEPELKKLSSEVIESHKTMLNSKRAFFLSQQKHLELKNRKLELENAKLEKEIRILQKTEWEGQSSTFYNVEQTINQNT